MSDQLLSDIKSSILDMQTRMQSTYATLAETNIEGESHDKSVKITMTATYTFVDIEFAEKALQGGVKEFKWRIREAWKDLSEKIQKATQNKTIELLQNMNVPDEIKNLTQGEDGQGGQGGQGRIGG